MKRNDPIRTVMSQAPQTVQKGEPLSKARKLLNDQGFHHLPVVDGNKLVGILSSRDILSLSFDIDGIDPRSLDAMLDHQFTIEQVMKSDVATLKTESTVRDAAEMLAGGAFHSVVVVDGEGQLEGIVTSTDMMLYLIDQY